MANTNDMVVNCLDAVTLIGYATSELSNKRKQNVKTSFNPNYGDLCNPNREVTEFLFGKGHERGTRNFQT